MNITLFYNSLSFFIKNPYMQKRKLGSSDLVRYGSVVAPTLQLRNAGSEVGDTRVLPATPATGSCNESVARTAGANNDLAGTTLMAADFNAGNVGVRLTRTTKMTTSASPLGVIYE